MIKYESSEGYKYANIISKSYLRELKKEWYQYDIFRHKFEKVRKEGIAARWVGHYYSLEEFVRLSMEYYNKVDNISDVETITSRTTDYMTRLFDTSNEIKMLTREKIYNYFKLLKLKRI